MGQERLPLKSKISDISSVPQHVDRTIKVTDRKKMLVHEYTPLKLQGIISSTKQTTCEKGDSLPHPRLPFWLDYHASYHLYQHLWKYLAPKGYITAFVEILICEKS